MTVASLNGYLYYVLFIDDHSKKTRIYFLKNKDGVLAKFQEFKAQMEIYGEKIPPSHSSVQKKTYIVLDEPTTPIDLVPPTDSVSPSNVPRDIIIGHKIPSWACQMIEEEEIHKALQGEIGERKRPKILSRYLSAMTHIIDSEPTCHGEASVEQVWQYAMTKKYQSILKNDVWDVVPRP
jgi:hypothetical protein